MVEQLHTARLLVDGRSMVESGRWHDGRWWFADWGTGEVLAADPHGRVTVMAEGPPPGRMGWSIGWLADGSLITTGPEITRHAADRTKTTYCERSANEIAISPSGHMYVNGFDFDFVGGGKPEPGWIEIVAPDGSHRRVAGDIQFPNGMVITPDGGTLVVAESFAGRLTAFDIEQDGSLANRRTWAEGLGPDGIAIDGGGGIWSQTADTFAHSGNPDAPAGAVVRVLDGGTMTHRIETELPCFACALGGPDGGQLLLLCNEFAGVDAMIEVQARRSARVFVADI